MWTCCRCEDPMSSYECNCSAGFTGEFCEENIDECLENLCANNATCIDQQANYTCQCLPGYEGWLWVVPSLLLRLMYWFLSHLPSIISKDYIFVSLSIIVCFNSYKHSHFKSKGTQPDEKLHEPARLPHKREQWRSYRQNLLG